MASATATGSKIFCRIQIMTTSSKLNKMAKNWTIKTVQIRVWVKYLECDGLLSRKLPPEQQLLRDDEVDEETEFGLSFDVDIIR